MFIVDHQVFALASVTQITSVKSGGSDVSNGGTATIPAGEKTAKITFSYRGFDDNDHIIEFRCSLDGVNYLKSNCPTQSAESQTAFTGPDGVTRTYNVRIGSVQVELPLPPVPKSYSFGVKVINDNGNISPAATWSFRIKSSDGSGSSAGGPADNNSPVEPHDTKVTVKFDSISIQNDHDPDTLNTLHPDNLPGQWALYASVQGKVIILLEGTDASTGKTIKFKPGTEVTVKLDGRKPLSIFTVGVEGDCNSIIEFFAQFPDYPFHAPHDWTPEVTDLYAKLYSNPNLDWKDEIDALQYKIGGYMIDSSCFNPGNRLGTLNLLYLQPNYQSIYTPDALQKIPEFYRKHLVGPDYSSTSSLKDFILKYTITVEH
jgi:hypothetical protein